jgi:hypothetical protein
MLKEDGYRAVEIFGLFIISCKAFFYKFDKFHFVFKIEIKLCSGVKRKKKILTVLMKLLPQTTVKGNIKYV